MRNIIHTVRQMWHLFNSVCSTLEWNSISLKMPCYWCAMNPLLLKVHVKNSRVLLLFSTSTEIIKYFQHLAGSAFFVPILFALNNRFVVVCATCNNNNNKCDGFFFFGMHLRIKTRTSFSGHTGKRQHFISFQWTGKIQRRKKKADSKFSWIEHDGVKKRTTTKLKSTTQFDVHIQN